MRGEFLVNVVSIKRYAPILSIPPTPEGSSLEVSVNVLIFNYLPSRMFYDTPLWGRGNRSSYKQNLRKRY